MRSLEEKKEEFEKKMRSFSANVDIGLSLVTSEAKSIYYNAYKTICSNSSKQVKI